MSIAHRSSGILLHPTSLPGPYGMGDFGAEAYAWVDALVQARQQWWQVLPLTPTGYADSPYQALSAFAGNPNLISPAGLVEMGLLNYGQLPEVSFPADHIDFDSGQVVGLKRFVLEQAWRNFRQQQAPHLWQAFEAFQVAEAGWLDDFALFMALKDLHHGQSWLEWAPELRERRPEALAQKQAQLAEPIAQHKFRQFLFWQQWSRLKAYANERGVGLIGDVPIFVSVDSADVWANPGFFLLDEQRRPTVVAGVPPDYFSPTGQLWGNPLYNWPVLRQSGYAWWVQRMKAALRQVDVVRVDHFRGFEANWEVPAGEPTAQNGRWVKGPAYELFDVLGKELGRLPIIAEDLGLITPEVDALRTRYDFPGMRILQFAFAGAVEQRFLPHNYEPNTVVYTGTHDNDTTLGWYSGTTPEERRFMDRYAGHQITEINWELMRLAWSSVAVLAAAPLQDVLGLGSEARMNLPGRPAGYWRWRYRKEQLTQAIIERLAEMTELYDRGQAAPGE